MSAATCPTCSRVAGQRIHCCPAEAAAELLALRAERDALADEVRRLKDENDVLEALRSEVMRAAEDQGVYL